MATSTEMTVVRQRASPLVIASEEARAVMLRRARRHSALVRVLRVAFPVAAVALFATYFVSVRLGIKVNTGGTLTVSLPTLIGDDLTMNKPQYQGYNKDGGSYVVHAETARQDVKQTGPVRLDNIDARMTQPDKTVTDIRARKGDFETKTGVLKVYGGIDIVSQNGTKARLASAVVHTKESRIVSEEPVQISMPTGELRGNKMELRQKVRAVTFTDGVVARLVPEQKPRTGGPRVVPGQGALMAGSNAPVDITSERLDLDDNAKIALFRGNVHAVQGEATLDAPELEVHYEGNATPGAKPAEGTEADPPAQGRLKKLIARPDVTLTRANDVVQAPLVTFDAVAGLAALTGGVVVTSPPDRRVTGDRADVDTANNLIRLTGNVVVTSGADRRVTADVADIDQRTEVTVLTGRVVASQGQNVIRGRRLLIDRKGGTSEIAVPGERVAARFVRDTRGEAPKQKKQPAEGGGISFSTDPNAPIDVEADTLHVDDNAKTATFRGEVRAVQGDFVIRTPEMVATYSGQGALADPAAKGAAPRGEGSAQLQTVKANRKVLITSKDNQTVTGDWAIFDVKGNTATVGGDVVVNQAPNIIRGPRLVIDMTTGQSRMEQVSGVGGAMAATGIGPVQPPAEPNPQAPKAIEKGDCGGRMCAVFFPNALKEQKDQKEKKAKDGQDAGTAKAKAPTDAARPAPAASGWSIATEPASRAN
ncbi:MAG: LPS export ABC transporter periplasmic protein LptC [Hyphomicrobiaceae bacterium]